MTTFAAITDSTPDAATGLERVYSGYFGLKENPFSITPDPRFLYMSQRHRDALAHLLFGAKQGGGFIQLTGEVGTGKTTLTRVFLKQLPPHINMAIILNPRQSAIEFVRTVCDELHVGYDPNSNSIKVLTDALNTYLLDAHSHGRRTLVLIDEAQNLAADVLEQIRLLTNLETATDKLLQIILVGQPELRVLLDRKDLRQLAQRITARYHLLPLSEYETGELIKHRLAVAGFSQPLFTPQAIRQVHKSSRGIPRLINVICDRALLGAYAHNERVIDRRIVLRAATEVTGELPRLPQFVLPRWTIATVAGIATLILTLTLINKLSSSAPELAGAPPAAPSAAVPAAPQTPAESPVLPGAQASAAAPGTLDQALGDARVRADFDTAMAHLFALWSKDYRSTGEMLPCERAQGVGLSCFTGKRGSLPQLQRINRPVILKLVAAEAQERYAVLTAANPGGLTVRIDAHEFDMTPSTLENYWHGGYVLLWEKPALETTLLAPGTHDKATLWLRKTLDKIERRSTQGNEADFFDAELQARVQAFQKSRGLMADGIVGEQTMVYLVSALNEPRAPRLANPAL